MEDKPINGKQVEEMFGYGYYQRYRMSQKEENPFPPPLRRGREDTWRPSIITSWERREEELRQKQRVERNAARAAKKAAVDAAAAEVAPAEDHPQDNLKRALLTPNRIRGRRS